MLNTCASLFVKNLEAKGLNFRSGTNSNNDSVVEFPYEGKITRLFFSGETGSYLSIYLVYEKVPENKVSDMIFTCNDLNCAYKWITFYVDKDNDVILHDDAILSADTADEEALELLVRMLKIGDEVKPQIMRTIYV